MISIRAPGVRILEGMKNSEALETQTATGKPLVLALIPCYNEEKNIASVVVKAQEHVDKVVVCDDGSTDMTSEIAEKLGAVVFRHDSNMGKGVALADLFQIARDFKANIAVTLDGDGQHNPDEIPFLVEPIIQGNADVVNGSREKRGLMPGHRKLGNRVLNGLTNRASNGALRDTQSGFRAFSKRALEEIQVTDHGMGVESQVLIDAMRKGLKVVEVPVEVIYGDGTSTYGSTRHGAYVATTIVRTVAERSPLLYLGVPGVAFLALAGVTGFMLFDLYNSTHYFSVPYAMITLGGFLVGLVLIVAALLLYSINNLEVRLRHLR